MHREITDEQPAHGQGVKIGQDRRTKEKKHEMQKFINESGYNAAPGYAY